MTSRENQQKHHARAQSDNAAPVRTRKKGKNNNIPVHHDRIALSCEMSPPPGAPSSNQIKGMPPVPGRVARRLPLSPRTNRPRLRRGSSARAIPPRSIRAPIKLRDSGNRRPLPPIPLGSQRSCARFLARRACVPLHRQLKNTAPWPNGLPRLGIRALPPAGSIHSIARGPGVAAAEPSQ